MELVSSCMLHVLFDILHCRNALYAHFVNQFLLPLRNRLLRNLSCRRPLLLCQRPRLRFPLLLCPRQNPLQSHSTARHLLHRQVRPPPPAMIFNECVPCLDLEKRHLLTFFFLVHIYSYTRSHSRHCAAFWKRWR